MKRLLLALPLLLLAAFAGVALWRLSSPPDNIIRSKLEGQPVPAFALPAGGLGLISSFISDGFVRCPGEFSMSV